jgi:hypothetical protein
MAITKRRFRPVSSSFDASPAHGTGSQKLVAGAFTIVNTLVAIRSYDCGGVSAIAIAGNLSAARAAHAAPPWPADAAQRALRIGLRPVEAAGVHHAEVAERKIVFHRIVGIEFAQ